MQRLNLAAMLCGWRAYMYGCLLYDGDFLSHKFDGWHLCSNVTLYANFKFYSRQIFDFLCYHEQRYFMTFIYIKFTGGYDSFYECQPNIQHLYSFLAHIIYKVLTVSSITSCILKYNFCDLINNGTLIRSQCSFSLKTYCLMYSYHCIRLLPEDSEILRAQSLLKGHKSQKAPMKHSLPQKNRESFPLFQCFRRRFIRYWI